MTRLVSEAEIDAYRRTYVDGFTDRLDEHAQRWCGVDQLAEWMYSWAVQGYRARDIDLLVSWVGENFEQRDPMNLGRVIRGPVEFRRVLTETFTAFPDSDFGPDGSPSLSLDGVTVTLPWRARGHFDGPLAWGPPGRKPLVPNGREFDFRGIDTYSFRDGKVQTMQSHYDPLEVLHQLGLMPDPNGPMLAIGAWPQSVMAYLQRRSNHFWMS